MSSADEADHFGIVPAETAKSMIGLQLLTAIMERALPKPPIQQVLDFRLVQVERGYTAFAGCPKFNYYNPLGSLHGGYTAALLDSCMACAVHSTLELREESSIRADTSPQLRAALLTRQESSTPRNQTCHPYPLTLHDKRLLPNWFYNKRLSEQ